MNRLNKRMCIIETAHARALGQGNFLKVKQAEYLKEVVERAMQKERFERPEITTRVNYNYTHVKWK